MNEVSITTVGAWARKHDWLLLRSNRNEKKGTETLEYIAPNGEPTAFIFKDGKFDDTE